ncbi:hypothetical protein [Agrobacterium tumefaciens]|uniref:hypothetical protein n=1 Tax=Agrobacterium tumefaciens TaxID=358 RepID=UPI0021D1C708|nr:hypothetical protein [Agrobacterium tumefaciens]UXT97948.1 hypothetical protein FY129_10920 [Agrobacterium tumefaciens]
MTATKSGWKGPGLIGRGLYAGVLAAPPVRAGPDQRVEVDFLVVRRITAFSAQIVKGSSDVKENEQLRLQCGPGYIVANQENIRP